MKNKLALIICTVSIIAASIHAQRGYYDSSDFLAAEQRTNEDELFLSEEVLDLANNIREGKLPTASLEIGIELAGFSENLDRVYFIASNGFKYELDFSGRNYEACVRRTGSDDDTLIILGCHSK